MTAYSKMWISQAYCLVSFNKYITNIYPGKQHPCHQKEHCHHPWKLSCFNSSPLPDQDNHYSDLCFHRLALCLLKLYWTYLFVTGFLYWAYVPDIHSYCCMLVVQNPYFKNKEKEIQEVKYFIWNHITRERKRGN